MKNKDLARKDAENQLDADLTKLVAEDFITVTQVNGEDVYGLSKKGQEWFDNIIANENPFNVSLKEIFGKRE